jgi:RES domain-containing protein
MRGSFYRHGHRLASLNRFYARIGIAAGTIRGDWNVLVNPVHADFAKTRFQEPEPLVFDARMFR